MKNIRIQKERTMRSTMKVIYFFCELRNGGLA